MTVTDGGVALPSSGVIIDTVTDTQNFILNQSVTIPLNSNLEYDITEYTITTNEQVSSIYLQQSCR